ncbi:MAG: hypothetical protein FJ317_08045 [SAR202 cluster bacterium]|nr:hypothetical protein [SAR202 cluster bacterium]
MTTQYKKPLPVPQGESDVFWQKAKQHELWLRRCDECGKAYFYPRDISPCCFSKKTSWMKASGRATLHTFAIVHRAPTPAFADDVPFVTAIVDLEEGPRMPTNIVGIGEPAPEKLRIGMKLQVVFEDATDTITLPKFKPA